MAEIPVEKKFAMLVEISRAQHFAWHDAVKTLFPGADMSKVVNKMWEITGHQTAGAYMKRLDKSKPLAPQVAASIVWSSQCMGEAATLEVTAGKDEAFVRHSDCPWFHWHKRTNLLHEDSPGCDLWFKVAVEDVNKALGSRLKVETSETLPDGGKCCLRRIWSEE
jgi:hypothetical protein